MGIEEFLVEGFWIVWEKFTGFLKGFRKVSIVFYDV